MKGQSETHLSGPIQQHCHTGVLKEKAFIMSKLGKKQFAVVQNTIVVTAKVNIPVQGVKSVIQVNVYVSTFCCLQAGSSPNSLCYSK